jgi:hypothetical protein
MEGGEDHEVIQEVSGIALLDVGRLVIGWSA